MTITPFYIRAIVDVITPGVPLLAGDKWQADISRRTITYNSDDLANGLYTLIRGLAIHEAGHLKYSQQVKAHDLIKGKENNILLLFNWLEDIRIEWKLTDSRNFYIISSLYKMYEDVFMEIIDLKEGKPFDELESIFLKVQQRQQQERESIVRSYDAIYTRTSSALVMTSTPLVSVDNMCGQIQGAQSSQALFDWFVSEIVPKISHLIPDDQDRKQGTSQVQNPKKRAANSMRQQSAKAGRGRGRFDSFESETYSLTQARTAIMPYAVVTANRVRSVLTQNASIRYTGSKIRGRLLSKNVYKAHTDTRRMFSKREQNDTPKYNFVLLVDSSGSTAGHIYRAELEVYALLQEIAKRLGFATHTIMYDERAITVKKESELENSYLGSDTRDDLALKAAAKVADSGSIVFLITDGAGYIEEHNCTEFTKSTGAYFAAYVIRHGNKTNYGIYGKVISRLEDLPIAIIQQLKVVFERR